VNEVRGGHHGSLLDTRAVRGGEAGTGVPSTFHAALLHHKHRWWVLYSYGERLFE